MSNLYCYYDIGGICNGDVIPNSFMYRESMLQVQTLSGRISIVSPIHYYIG